MRNSPLVIIDGHEMVPKNDENALMKAVANQPVSVALDAGGKDFQFYSEVSFRDQLPQDIKNMISKKLSSHIHRIH